MGAMERRWLIEFVEFNGFTGLDTFLPYNNYCINYYAPSSTSFCGTPYVRHKGIGFLMASFTTTKRTEANDDFSYRYGIVIKKTRRLYTENLKHSAKKN
jgi:hypothetical protein